jgi:hypothetical protein
MMSYHEKNQTPDKMEKTTITKGLLPKSIVLAAVSLCFSVDADAQWRMSSLKASPEAPNILWITTDQQRWDTIHSLGNPHVHTPNIDRLVKEGVSFTSAYVQSPVCTPSRASFMTGMYPSYLRSSKNGQAYWADASPLISTVLDEAGFDAGLAGKFHLSTAMPICRSGDRKMTGTDCSGSVTVPTREALPMTTSAGIWKEEWILPH